MTLEEFRQLDIPDPRNIKPRVRSLIARHLQEGSRAEDFQLVVNYSAQEITFVGVQYIGPRFAPRYQRIAEFN